MAFTDVWDNSQPPDTQAAKLLGQDIRSLKLDIQERMAAISGLDANKQAFEAGFAGVLYFATDTSKIYRWSGAAWVDITTDFISATGSLSDYNNTTQAIFNNTTGDGPSVAIPAAAIQVGSIMEIRAGLISVGASGAGATAYLSINGYNTGAIFNHGQSVTFYAMLMATAADKCTMYLRIETGNGLGVGSTVSNSTVYNVSTPFAGFTIKTVLNTALGAGSQINLDYVCVRVKK